MAGILGCAVVPVECGNCHKKTKKTFAWINSHSQFKCSKCGTIIKLKADSLRRAIRSAEKGFADFAKNSVRTIKIQF